MDIPGRIDAAPAVTDSWEQEQLTRPFLKAAEDGDAPAVLRLLGAGADPNAREEPQLSERYSTGWTSGRTALIKAAQQGYTEVVRALVDAGADLDARDDDYWSALHWAANNGHTPVIRQLMAAGAKVDPRDVEKRTPLVYASIRGHADAVAALLAAHADAGALDRLGKNALGLAQERGHRAVVRMLLDASETSPANGHGPGGAAAPEVLARERDEALARCRALEAEVSTLRARLAAA